jgi:ribosomal protein S18 acetylase RimI-like enzyme
MENVTMEKGISIREAEIKDLPTLLKFEQEIILAERPMDPTIRKGRVNYYDLGELITSKEAQVLVACSGLQVVASGYARIKEARHYLDHSLYGYLGFMYTLPEYRGRGINAKIIEGLKNWVFSKGLTEIRLTVYDDNEPALRAYEKVGFKKHIVEMRLATDSNS